ncbi:MAG: cell division protein FtsA [Bdellovibrionaceae bacterium]|nr:cell division protein FtsA [Pseudobdellovibrionaceae bacterium]
MSKEQSSFLTSIDIGTTKVTVSVAKPLEEKLEIIGFASTAHRGFHQGQLVDPHEIISALAKAKREIEATSNITLVDCWLTIADSTITTVQSKASQSIRRVVKQSDIQNILEAAQEAAQVRSDREILHVYAQSYKINGKKVVQPPIAEKTNFLEVQTLVVTGSRRNNQTARDCIKSIGMNVLGVVCQGVAVAAAHTEEATKGAGIAIVDIGGSQTDIACYIDGHLSYLGSLPVGGVNFTQDLAIGLKTPQTQAEEIKKNHGAALVELVSSDEVVTIERVRGQGHENIPVRFVSEILEARSEETLGLILKTISDVGLLGQLKDGIILTGGGSLLPGLPELGEFTFEIKFKRAATIGLLSVNPQALSPVMAASMGVLHYARERQYFEPSVFSVDTFKDNWMKLKSFIENIL